MMRDPNAVQGLNVAAGPSVIVWGCDFRVG